jgi:hypothetical protein
MIKAMEGLHNLCHHPYKAMLRGSFSSCRAALLFPQNQDFSQ